MVSSLPPVVGRGGEREEGPHHRPRFGSVGSFPGSYVDTFELPLVVF